MSAAGHWKNSPRSTMAATGSLERCEGAQDQSSPSGYRRSAGDNLTGDIELRKQALRERMRLVRAELSRIERAADRAGMGAAAEEYLFSLPEVADASSVLLFYSFWSEIETRGIAERVWNLDKRLLLPYLDKGAMHAAHHPRGGALVLASYGPKEPSDLQRVDPEEIDVVVTPGLAFDRQGHRLGYGGGFYDRYFASLRPDAARIGIAFSVQLVDEVPAGPDDVPVHIVVTDAGVVDCREPSA